MQLLNVKQHGFHGCFYPVEGSKNKVVIVVTGSEGGIRGAQKISEFYFSHQVSSLAVAYFKTNQTPRCVSEIPVDYIDSAVKWLKLRGYKKIAIDGISKGAELALLAASLIPDISFVIARSPSFYVSEGLGKNDKFPTGTSSWSWRGNALPFTGYTDRVFHTMRNILREREFSVLRYYQNLQIADDSIIPVEKINGPILLLSSKIDTVWPSSENGEKICSRLKLYHFPYPFRHEMYETVSHLLTPMDIRAMKFAFKVERKQSDACSEARKKAVVITLDWINNIWG
jgi:BAAT / Acyl-CoA thioester hydrolase C terminal.